MSMNFTESDSPTLNNGINHMDVHGDAMQMSQICDGSCMVDLDPDPSLPFGDPEPTYCS